MAVFQSLTVCEKARVKQLRPTSETNLLSIGGGRSAFFGVDYCWTGVLVAIKIKIFRSRRDNFTIGIGIRSGIIYCTN
jgi:hypothetical protein